MKKKSVLSLIIFVNLALSAFSGETNLPKEVTVRGVEFVLIPEGWFYLGQDLNDKSDPLAEQWYNRSNLKRVWLDAYYIAKFETRASLFADFLNATRDESVMIKDSDQCIVVKGANGLFSPLPGKENHPANGLSWDGSDKLARWAGFRLPTEAEWVKAARGADKRHWPWGNVVPDRRLANYGMGVGSRLDAPDLLYPVDSFPEGVSPYGIYNMSGNIREWIADWYSKTYVEDIKEGAINPKGPENGTAKIMKGGRWADLDWDTQVWSKYPDNPEAPFQCNGVRFAADVETIQDYLKNQSMDH